MTFLVLPHLGTWNISTGFYVALVLKDLGTFAKAWHKVAARSSFASIGSEATLDWWQTSSLKKTSDV